MKRGGPLKRSTPQQISAWRRRSKRIKPISDKQAASNAVLADVREIVLERDGHRCQGQRYGLDHRCNRGVHVHHIKQRSLGGKHEPANLVTLCPAAHEWVHCEIAQATALGLLA